ncbi:hypothetical protein [Brevundimonas sp.]|uniref:hypothetical protein n=1 Tax=Brevundimonas sp. TaxID=1871086 RepID=UPI003A8DCA2D
MVDKLRLKVVGTVRLPDTVSFDAFTGSIAGGLLRSPMTPGRAYTSTLGENLTVSGKVTFRARAGDCTLEAVLHLNPTRTLNRALDVAQGRDLADLAPQTFFTGIETLTARSPEFGGPPNAEPTLDGNDNILPTPQHRGGTWPARREAFQAEFLALFEVKLRALLLEAMTPLWMEREVSLSGCRVERDDGVVVELDWHRVIVQSAEVYWERETPDAPAVAHRMMEGGLALARSIRVTEYASEAAHYEIVQEEGFPSLSIPLRGQRTISLNVYAKTRHLLRTEVRYVRDFHTLLRGCSSPVDRLVRLLDRLKDDAARRLPWDQLAHIAALPPSVAITDVADLIAQLSAACRGHEGSFDEVTRSVLMTGGLFSDDGRIAGSEIIVRRLERAGVLCRLAFQQKERRTNRRYGLTERFGTARRKMLLGFAPVDNGVSPDYDAPALRETSATNLATNRITRTALSR